MTGLNQILYIITLLFNWESINYTLKMGVKLHAHL